MDKAEIIQAILDAIKDPRIKADARKLATKAIKLLGPYFDQAIGKVPDWGREFMANGFLHAVVAYAKDLELDSPSVRKILLNLTKQLFEVETWKPTW